MRTVPFKNARGGGGPLSVKVLVKFNVVGDMYVYFNSKSVNILYNTTQEYILYNIIQRSDTSNPHGFTWEILQLLQSENS